MNPLVNQWKIKTLSEMITIVESGSTKTEWAFVEGENILFFSTGGINPSTQVVVKEVLSSEEVKKT